MKSVSSLLVSGPDLNVPGVRGNTLLHEVISSRNGAGIAKLLLDHGCDPNIKNRTGNTAIHLAINDYAAEWYRVQSFKVINSNPTMSVFERMRKHHIDLIRILVEGFSDLNIPDSHGRCPLHLVKDIDLAKLMIANRADVNIQDRRGKRPLHYAAFCGKDDIVKLLIKKGSKLEAKDIFGRTALHYGAAFGH